MEDKGKSRRTIKEHIRKLRKLIDESKDSTERRIAYAMEHALRWAILDTVGWESMDVEAKKLAAILRKELKT